MRRFTWVLATILLVFGPTLGAITESQTCSVTPYFVSPDIDGVIERVLISLINNAQETLDIAMYSFTDNELGDAVIAAHRRGVQVRVLLDDGQEEAQGGEYSRLLDAGIPVCVEKVTGLFHHKFAVIDGYVVVTGSYNWTENANDKNFENIVVIVCANIAQAYLQEFEKLWKSLCPNGKCQESVCLEKLNTVSFEKLVAIKGIGEKTALKVIAARPFESLVELIGIHGIGPTRCTYILEALCSPECARKYCHY